MQQREAPDLIVDSGEGFVDLALGLHAFARDSDGTHRFTAPSAAQGKATRIRRCTWTEQKLEDSAVSLYWGEAQVISTGTESDQFLETLNQLYGKAVPAIRRHPKVEFAAVGLDGCPEMLGSKPVKMKLFFEAGDEELYAEFYLNCDAQN